MSSFRLDVEYEIETQVLLISDIALGRPNGVLTHHVRDAMMPLLYDASPLFHASRVGLLLTACNSQSLRYSASSRERLERKQT